MEEYITACPRNCYSTCSFRVQVDNNIIRRILPYPGNLATPEGPCIKGLSYLERTNSPDRIIHPLRKKTTGEFERITMATALELAADKLGAVREHYGSHSVLWYRGSGMSGLVNETGIAFWKKFGGVTTTFGNLCWPAGLEAVRLTLGDVRHNVPWDLENSKTIVIWGKNPAETNIHEIAFIAKAKERGGRVIVIDPVRTPTADKADLFISPRPGTDIALALAAANVIVNEDLVDHDFINKNVSGFEAFSRSLSISPAEASGITGIPERYICCLAREIASGKPVTIIPGYGLQRHYNGGQTIRALLALSVITGNIGIKGAGFNYANLQSYVFDEIKEPLSYYPDAIRDFPFRRSVSVTDLGRDMLSLKDPRLRAVWVERGNPVLQSPDSPSVIEAFSKLEFRVVTEQFMTDTAEMADLILPAKDMFEQTDVLGSYWSPYICFKPAVIIPPGEVMPESEIYYHLAKKLRLDISTDELPEPGNAAIEKWLDKRMACCPGISLDDLRKGPVLAPELEQIAFSDMKFGTASGKIELYSGEAERRWGVSPLPEYTKNTEETSEGRYPLHFITPNSAGRIHSQFGNLRVIKTALNDTSAMLSQTDAAERNINEGDRIRIFNDNGNIIAIASISPRVPAGAIILPNGIWLDEGGGGNFLVSGRFTDMGYGAAFHDTMAEVEIIKD